MQESARIAGVELGGTKAIAIIAEGRTIIDRRVVPTATPEQTLGTIRKHLEAWHAETPFDALGIASFGPLQLDPTAGDFGHVLATPKPGWSGADIAGALAAPFSCPWSIDTDVNGAALGEWRWGAGQGSSSLCYLTVGTGVGGGLLIDGRPVHGALHPEIGHMRLRRVKDDDFPGICPFHGDCIEGLVSGPALHARFGRSGADIAPDDPRWARVAQDLAELTAVVLLTLSPQRILIGGGIGVGRPFLFPLICERTVELLAAYLPYVDAGSVQEIVTAPALGPDAGPLGAIALGCEALASHLSLRA